MKPNERPAYPVQRIKGVDNINECLKYPGHQCNCWMADNEKRKDTLRSLRQRLGFYGFGTLSPTLADEYMKQRSELCSGWKKTFRMSVEEHWQTLLSRLPLVGKKH